MEVLVGFLLLELELILLNYLFVDPSLITCIDAGDLNDSGNADLGDAIYLLGTLFVSGPPPAAPYPNCGLDNTADPLGCASFAPCP